MATTNEQLKYQKIHGPGWHEDAKTPVVDGKYIDPKTGELCVASSDHAEYGGPPDVDIIIKSQHAETAGCTVRAARPFPMEALLFNVMRIVHDRKLGVDTLIATPYAIRVILSHELTVEEFNDLAMKMINGLLDRSID